MKPPIESRPLRSPGESLAKERSELWMRAVAVPTLIATILIGSAISEWYRWAVAVPPSPWLHTGVAFLGLSFALLMRERARPRLAWMKQGLDGERETGHILEGLRAQGAFVFHDVPGAGFNLDHVVVHTSGIYVVETKTTAKPLRGLQKIHFDGKTIRRGDKSIHTGALVQAAASSTWLAGLLRESTGKRFRVRPVIVFPGRWVERTVDATTSHVWVINPKQLLSMLKAAPVRLSAEDVNLCKFHLERYIRSP